jgi:regulator of sirC expression with transglutaminase-like and TPR domain
LEPGSRCNSFAELAKLSDERLNLAEGALLIAADDYPGLDVSHYLRRLDALASGIAERLSSGSDPWQQVEAINDFLFKQRHFRGNVENYYDPRNSYLNEVLDRRLGIPITLAVVYIEVARRLRLPIFGVNMPGHFLVRYYESDVDLFVDPFNSGRIMTLEDCHDMITSMFQGNLSCFGHYLQPVSSRVILTRMLNNLKLIHFNTGDTERGVSVLDKLILLNPDTTAEYRERGLLHMMAQRYRAALCDFMHYLGHAQNAADVRIIHDHIDMILSEMQRKH